MPSQKASAVTRLRQYLRQVLSSRADRRLITNPQLTNMSLEDSQQQPLTRRKQGGQPKRIWTTAAGVIATVIILVWAGTASNRSKTSKSVNSSSNIQRISQ